MIFSPAERAADEGRYPTSRGYRGECERLRSLLFQLKEHNTKKERLIHSYRRKHKDDELIQYWNIPMSFDIETSSWTEGEDYRAMMYVFVFGVWDEVFVGRTWHDFMHFLDIVREELGVCPELKATIYVHNLGYEFQFIRKRFLWKDVFSNGPRAPLRAETEDGFIFKDSYALSGYSLAKVGEHLTRYPVRKMTGDLDYHLLRNSLTPLSPKEWGYVFNDGLVVLAYVKEEMERNGNDLNRIPLTKTGYVRRLARTHCMYHRKSHKKGYNRRYQRMVHALTLDPEEYMELKEAFQGGFTHANVFNSNVILHDVKSWDFTSSYPAVMLSEKFPMSRGERVVLKDFHDFEEHLKRYCCLFRIRFENIESRYLGDNPISASKCRQLTGWQVDNGRIIKARTLETTMTDIDWQTISRFYTWSNMHVKDMICYRRGYLPKEFMEVILDLYQKKTQLKGVEDKKAEYLNSKEQLNSMYGMTVTDIVRPEIVYDNEEGWEETAAPDLKKAIDKYNSSRSRFMFYPWGIWVTAYARRNLFTGIYALRGSGDYIYSDTDSLKILNWTTHQQYFDRYNRMIVAKLDKALEYNHIDTALTRPKTVKGVEKQIGIWDDDGFYTLFRTCGAKRYICATDRDFSITISGVSKKKGHDWLMAKDKGNISEIVNDFRQGLLFPAEYRDDSGNLQEGSGKQILTYVDEDISGEMTDYLGNTERYHEKSCIHMAPTSYNLSMTDEYVELITRCWSTGEGSVRGS